MATKTTAKPTARTTKRTAAPTPPVKRNLTDAEVEQMVRDFLAAGLTNVNAISKAVRGTDRGTNTKRLRRAFQHVLEEQAKAAPKPRATRTRKAPAPAA